MSVVRSEESVQVRVVRSVERQLHQEQRTVHYHGQQQNRCQWDRPPEKGGFHGNESSPVQCERRLGFPFPRGGLCGTLAFLWSPSLPFPIFLSTFWPTAG